MTELGLSELGLSIGVDNLYWLDRIQTQDQHLVGDNAFYLSYLAQQGHSVLPSFAISAAAVQAFLESICWSDPLLADLPNSSLHLDVDNPLQLQAIAQEIQQEVLATPLPDAWMAGLTAAVETLGTDAIALRPSLGIGFPAEAAQSTQRSPKNIWQLAELMETQLCWTDAANLAQGLKAAWVQLFRAKSLFCWQRYRINWQQLNLAVLVQPVWPAIASGSLQSYADGFEIWSTWGLKQSIDRGEVVPDYYRVQSATQSLERQQLGTKFLAYALAIAPASHHPSPGAADPCLQSYPLDNQQQERYSLDLAQINDLIHLAQSVEADLVATLPHRRSAQAGIRLEWLLYQPAPDAPPQFYLTQASPYQFQAQPLPPQQWQSLPEKISPFAPASLSLKPIVQGLAAATGRAVAPAWVVRNPKLDLQSVPPGRILVAATITPDWLPWLKTATGIVAERGGMTSHSAIVARELGIPAVVGATHAIHAIQTGDLLVVDGDRGMVYPAPAKATNNPINGNPTLETEFGSQPSPAQSPPAQPQNEITAAPPPFSLANYRTKLAVAIAGNRTDAELALQPVGTQLMVNLSQPSSIQRASRLPIDGVGLLRSELLFLEILDGRHPDWWLQQERQGALVEQLSVQVRQFTQAFAPRPVFYRSLDWRSHEFQLLAGGPTTTTEVNPMLGLRGTLRYQLDPRLFDLELAALAQVQQTGDTNIQLLLPFVRTVEEFVFCRQRVVQAGLMQQPKFQLWIAAEVPSILFLMSDYVDAGVQGISIGSNDLTQLLLGIDRDLSEMTAALDERHPAVQRAIAQLIRLANTAGIPCAICGQAPALYPELIDKLIRWGISAISVNLEAVERTYTTIARAERSLLLQAARQELGEKGT